MSMLVKYGEPRAAGVWCSGCELPITERYYLLAIEKEWHVRCLRCSHCQLTLDSQRSCFARDGRIYCKGDYYRLFVTKHCERCQQAIAPSELVMRARDLVYHVQCFTCEECGRLLTTGQTFGLREGTVLCRDHFTPPEPLPPHKGRPRKKKFIFDSIPEGQSNSCCFHSESTDSCPEDPCEPRLRGVSRPKRMRTSFKHHQLREMKLFFSVNHNPDSKELKQLAQKTGLHKRVLQVWFQNARAKWRRNLVQQHTLGPEVAQDCRPLSELAPAAERKTPPELLPITQEEQYIQTFANLL